MELLVMQTFACAALLVFIYIVCISISWLSIELCTSDYTLYIINKILIVAWDVLIYVVAAAWSLCALYTVIKYFGI